MFEEELDRYWKTVVNTIQDGVMIVDTHGRIISVNKAFEVITGYLKDEIIGKTCETLSCNLFEMARKNHGEHWCVLFKTGTMDRRRCTLVKKDGTIIYALKNASILHDAKGNVIGAVETIADITEIIEKDNQIEAFRRELRSKDGFHGIIGVSSPMRQVFDLIENAAHSDAPVIIYGESGTGKELVSGAIHDIGERNKDPFIKVNCAALNESLLESELFGHVKGAFTGAYQNREGRFENAHGGDIFLDEIGDLPLTTQVKLLRVLEDKIIERVGENRPIPVNVRIISATNRNLVRLVDQGVIRKDFYFRINVIPITLPPLRDRVDDIPLLAEFFFRKNRLKSGKNIQGISNDTMGALMNYRWPGNVRELKSAFEYAFVTCQETMIQPHHLPPNIINGKGAIKRVKATSFGREEIKKQELIEALEKSGGNQSEAARNLGVTRVTIWNRMKRFGIYNNR
ncbi:MAG: sigma 54-interacting transcriptional regulator [Desulfobacterales bacterium]|jgi:two-component system, NtrC family, response regulator HydG|nr:sigma 54-interacting transcriptional regulator [Desulfobacteraceae bacterium]MBT4365247.1 sigma 54-interacting transcriptional regulator [Desulfobacteraceae bacterium]MBT7086202.1 sigma 54-interacting transcriptional regulator [Desulfobacterales bacterium]MBT7695793.1 sigma 54-interacting transcriptional regulator [Desulfobacterales bacterium]